MCLSLGWEALKAVGPLLHGFCFFRIHLSGKLLSHKLFYLALPLPLAVFLAFDIPQDIFLTGGADGFRKIAAIPQLSLP